MSKPTQTEIHTSAPPALAFAMDGHQLRVVMRDDEPWFVASDVAEALGYRNAPDAVRNLGDHQKGSTQIVRRTSGGNPNVTIISESGLYRLVLSSRKKEAEKFSEWVTGEVLPSIRRTGSYSVKHQSQRERQIGRCQALLRDIERSNSKFCRDGLISLAGAAFADVGLTLPDLKGLRPLQMPLPA
jgi:prophage antirepressor-like protein